MPEGRRGGGGAGAHDVIYENVKSIQPFSIKFQTLPVDGKNTALLFLLHSAAASLPSYAPCSHHLVEH
jgi:hypothetical protein